MRLGGARVARNDTRLFPSASLYKLGVAWAVLRQVDAGAVGRDTPIEITEEDAVKGEPEAPCWLLCSTRVLTPATLTR
jgi:beta-lactamase class A